MRVLLADNQKGRAALKRLLGQDPELCLVGEAAEVKSLLAQAEATHPDLVLLNWELPGLGCADLLPTWLGRSLKVVAFGEHVQARQEALAAGVDAFVSKKEPIEQLLNTVRAVGRLSPCFVQACRDPGLTDKKRGIIMFVNDRMSSPPVTITPDTPFQKALKLMRDQRFRRLPVVDKKGKLVGIVSERDLLYASPSPATSLSIWELHYLLSQIQVRQIMTQDVIITTPDTPIEDASHLMVENKIGGLPVVDEEERVVGVITETDIFKAFNEMFADGYPGLRLTLQVPAKKSVLADLCWTISEMNGSIVSVGSFSGNGDGERGLVVVKVRDINKDQLVGALEALGDHVLDVRDV